MHHVPLIADEPDVRWVAPFGQARFYDLRTSIRGAIVYNNNIERPIGLGKQAAERLVDISFVVETQ
jgi:hypothetical protein